MSLKCIIIDDDDFAIKSLKNIIDKLDKSYKIEVIKTFNDSVEAINEINNFNFDLLFIDYEMPGYNGIEFVKKMANSVNIIFVTSFSEKSIEITNEVNIIGFLSKPPQKEELLKIIKNKDLLITSSQRINKISIPSGTKDYYFNKDEIYYIKSDDKYKDFYDFSNTKLGCIEIPFNKLENLLNDYGFERISKSYMINVNKIRERTSTKVVLENKKEIEIGKSQKVNFIKRIKNWF